MKPSSFQHLVPTSVTQALSMLGDHAPEARVLAGGQSLVPMMNFRLASPDVLIDLNRVPDLAYIKDDGATISIGAMTRERTIENSEVVRRHIPLLHKATTHIGHLPIRSRGTIGGSIANADPAAEYPAAVLALDCVLVASSTRGSRRIAASNFFDGVMTTTLEPDEILTEVILPKAQPGSGSAFTEIARRHGDFALVGVAVQITFDGRIVTDIRLAACGVGEGPVRLASAEALIRHDGASADAVIAAARAAAEEVEPDSDTHASAEYRRRLTAVVTARALTSAIQEAGAAA